jgi:hypothetical protein
MNHVIRRTWLSALVLAAMTVFAGCAAETGDPEGSTAGQEQAGHAANDGDGEAVGSAQQGLIKAVDGAVCDEWMYIHVGGGEQWCCSFWNGGTTGTNKTCNDALACGLYHVGCL